MNQDQNVHRNRNLYRERNLKHFHPTFVIGIVLVVAMSGALRSLMTSEMLIVGMYLVGAALAAIAWYWNSRWTQTLWTIGMLFAVYSTASMALTAQYWLAAFAVVFLLAILIYPPIAKQTHQEVQRRRR